MKTKQTKMKVKIMFNKFTRWITILGLSAISTIWIANLNSHKVNAQTPPPVGVDVIKPASQLNVSELMSKAFNENTGDFFEQSTIGGQLNLFFGWREFPEGSYSDNSINRDSQLIYLINKDYFKQLTQSEPTIRTEDLPNPFDTSIQQNPSYIRK